MGRKYKQLSQNDRISMETLLNKGHSVQEVADYLHVHRSTIYREMKRGEYVHRNSDYTEEVRYSSDKGQQTHDWNAQGKGRNIKIGNDLVVADLKGKICRLSLENPKPLWCMETGEAKKSFTNPVYDEEKGVLVYASQKQGFFVINAKTGKTLDQWKGDEKNPWESNYAPVALTEGGWTMIDMKGNVRRYSWSGSNQKAEKFAKVRNKTLR